MEIQPVCRFSTGSSGFIQFLKPLIFEGWPDQSGGWSTGQLVRLAGPIWVLNHCFQVFKTASTNMLYLSSYCYNNVSKSKSYDVTIPGTAQIEFPSLSSIKKATVLALLLPVLRHPQAKRSLWTLPDPTQGKHKLQPTFVIMDSQTKGTT